MWNLPIKTPVNIQIMLKFQNIKLNYEYTLRVLITLLLGELKTLLSDYSILLEGAYPLAFHFLVHKYQSIGYVYADQFHNIHGKQQICSVLAKNKSPIKNT